MFQSVAFCCSGKNSIGKVVLTLCVSQRATAPHVSRI
jgi:hypothetical protein